MANTDERHFPSSSTADESKVPFSTVSTVSTITVHNMIYYVDLIKLSYYLLLFFIEISINL